MFGAVVAFFLLPSNPTRFQSAAYPAFGLVVGFVASFGVIRLIHWPLAIIRQRNEAWELVERLTALTGGLRNLVKVTPAYGQSLRPNGGSDTSWEIDAFLDIETLDANTPLHNCRVKLTELLHRSEWTEKSTGEKHVSWPRDAFYQGQTYFFTWSGRPPQVDAIDVHSKERACIAVAINSYCQWSTTSGAVGHIFYGDEYRLAVEITCDNSLPLVKEYWLHMRSAIGEGEDSVIEEWNSRPRN